MRRAAYPVETIVHKNLKGIEACCIEAFSAAKGCFGGSAIGIVFLEFEIESLKMSSVLLINTEHTLRTKL